MEALEPKTRVTFSEDVTGILPTNGFTLEEFKYRKAEIITYDLGGGERIRSIWKNYYSEAGNFFNSCKRNSKKFVSGKIRGLRTKTIFKEYGLILYL